MRLQLVDDRRTFNLLYQSIQSASIIGVDTESTGLDVHKTRLLLVSMYLNDTRFVLDMTKLDHALFMRLQPYLEDETILKVGHNLTVEWKQFYKYGKIMMTGMHDTMVAEQMLLAGLNVKFDLKSVAKRRLNRDMDKAVRNEFIDLPEDATFTAEQIEYSGNDAVIPVEIYYQQIQEIHQKELTRIYDLEMHIIAPTAMMEYTGVPINRDTLMAMVEPFERYIKTSEKAFQDLIIEYGGAETIRFDRDGYFAVNANSQQQVLPALQRIGITVKSLGAKIVQRWDMLHNKKQGRKYKDFDIDYHTLVDDEDVADALDLYLILNNKVLRAYAFLQGAKKLLGTFILGLIKAINPETGRVYPGFRSYGAHRTGRYSSTGPNFQNLPNDKKLQLLGLGAYSIRQAIETSDKRMLIIADYSGIELVILAVLSGDEHLMNEILRGDIHTYVTREVLGYKEITKENKKQEPHSRWRDASKTLSYGIAYGTTGRNIAETLNIMLGAFGFKITASEGDDLIAAWYNAFPKTAAYLNANAEKAVRDKYVTDTWGRRRNWTPEMLTDKWKLLAAGREGKNMPIQGTSATMTKLAIRLLWERLDMQYARLIITVHDELVIESSLSYLETAKQHVKDAMEEAIRQTLPLVANDVGKYESLSVTPKESRKYDK